MRFGWGKGGLTIAEKCDHVVFPNLTPLPPEVLLLLDEEREAALRPRSLEDVVSVEANRPTENPRLPGKCDVPSQRFVEFGWYVGTLPRAV